MVNHSTRLNVSIIKGVLKMEHDYLEWINRAYEILVNNQKTDIMTLRIFDGYITVYRLGDIIRVDICRSETIKGV